MKTWFVAVLLLSAGFCAGATVMRPSLKQLRAELATRDAELAKVKAEEDLAVKELKVCTAALKTQNDQIRQNNQELADWIRRERKE